MVICEDLLWYYPTVDLVNAESIDTMLFPTDWWDEYPHQLPHVACASWAKRLQVLMYTCDRIVLRNYSLSLWNQVRICESVILQNNQIARFNIYNNCVYIIC